MRHVVLMPFAPINYSERALCPRGHRVAPAWRSVPAAWYRSNYVEYEECARDLYIHESCSMHSSSLSYLLLLVNLLCITPLSIALWC